MSLKDISISGDDLALLLGMMTIELVDVLALPGQEATALNELALRVDSLAERAIVPHLSDVLRGAAKVMAGQGLPEGE